MLLLSVANVFLDVYFDVDIEMLAEDLWPGQDQIMMFILMSRAGLKLMLTYLIFVTGATGGAHVNLFLAGVNFYRFNAKNWQKLAFFGANFSVKKRI